MISESQFTEYGKISSDFLRDRLADLCVEKIGVQTGPFGSQLHNEDYVEKGTPIITVEHLSDNRINHQDTPFVSDEDKKRLTKYHLAEGDIVFSRVGSVDRRALVRKAEEGWLFSGRCLRVRVDKKKIDPVYLSYFFGLETFKNYIRSIAVGATMPSINTKILSDVPIYYPQLSEQKRIADILYSIDDKIELNRQINQTLEHIAQAIFKSWFVDFDPVKAKITAKQKWEAKRLTAKDGGNDGNAGAIFVERAAMRAISGKTDEEIDQLTPEQLQQLIATASLFPGELEDSELGEIPKGWKVKSLLQMIELIGGGTPKRSEEAYWSGNIPWFSVKDAPADGDVFVIDTEEKITELGLNRSSTKLLPEGVTIISARGTVGRLALVGVPMAMNQSCYGVKAGDGVGPAFNYFNLKRAISILKQRTHGAVFDTITTSTFDSVYAVKPCEIGAKEFDRLISPLLERIKTNLFENATLVDCRDSLLPKLLSGELYVTQAVQQMEGVA